MNPGFIFEECDCPMCELATLANNLILGLVKLDTIVMAPGWSIAPYSVDTCHSDGSPLGSKKSGGSV